MTDIRYTRNLFLRCMNIVYLFAFTSLYVQIPGLYGSNGVLPARTQLDAKEGTTLAAKMHMKPTLLWLAPYIGLNTEYMMDILAIIGMFLSFTGFISQKFCCKPIFAALWSLYYSLYQVGQTFMWYQWDILLLESGFLCILVAPFRYRAGTRRRPTPSGPSEKVSFWLVRWLVFRLLFSTGIVKLISGCPSWWSLTALNIHFESMVIPSPLAYYCHYLPPWFLKLNTVFANFAEIFLPIVFFFPLQSVKTIAFYIELFLQVCIIITGNFNFYNFLTIALLISLLDDRVFYKIPTKTSSSKILKIFNALTTLTVYGILLYVIYELYSIKLLPGGVIDSKIAFSKKEFDTTLGKVFPVIVSVGLISLIFTSLKAFFESFTQPSTTFTKITASLSTLLYTLAALFVFTDSLVPFSSLHPAGNATVLPSVRHFHAKLSHLHLTNGYGLFRRMTGVGGRPEVIIEGANHLDGPWQEYSFLYKPGNVNTSLPLVAPHQPRLDWQMWFAALGTYHQNPWLMSLAYRLLTNQPEVLSLLSKHNPYADKPPKYVRANLYHYHYVPWSQRWSKTWWRREKVSEYFPVFSKDHPPLLDYLRNLNIISPDQKEPVVTPWIKAILEQLRSLFNKVEPGLLLWSIFLAGLSITILQFSLAPLHSSTPAPRPKK